MAWSDVAPSTTCRDVLRADPYSPLAQRGWHAHPRMRCRREARSRTLELHIDSTFSSQRVYTAQHCRCDGSQSRHDVLLDPTMRRETEAGIWRFAAVKATFVDSSGRLLTVGVWHSWNSLCRRQARCSAGGGTTAGVMLQVTERGGTTVFAWTQTNR